MSSQEWSGLIIAGMFITGFAIERWLARRRRAAGLGRRDYVLALSGIGGQALSSRVNGLLFGALLVWLLPGGAGSLREAPFWPAFFLIWISEEFCFYWVHRWAHTKRWLWKLHRTHHSAGQLGILVTFRYNVFWPLLQPQGWFAAIAVYLGLLHVYLPFVLMTYTIGVLTHVPWRWDLALHRQRWLRPFMWLLERVITLPDTHHAHHGLGRHGRIRGNYATSLLLWDVIFGTAYFPHARQERFGLGQKQFDWKEEAFWPLVRRP
jgi:sterol desaturase/sphingolipid hydroxylase (fatty acid hydroxylase superfamily)